MDPDCAICNQPALAQCECEAKGLDIAVKQAEQRMMAQVFNDIRAWVRGHAQDYILSYFSMLTTRRKDQYADTIRRMTEHAAFYYNARPHPREVQLVDQELKRGIDEDWKASVQRYPEVLGYFYSLVELNLPGDDEPGVRDPPLSALLGAGAVRGGGAVAERERKVRLREPSEIEERRSSRRKSRERLTPAPPPPPMERPMDRDPREVMRRGGRPPSTPAYAPPMGTYGYVSPPY